jgi:hypothetical protein
MATMVERIAKLMFDRSADRDTKSPTDSFETSRAAALLAKGDS